MDNAIVVWYDTAQAVYDEYMAQLERAAGESFDGVTLGGEDADGHAVELTPADMVHGIAAQGRWGFCDGQRIHAWIADHVDDAQAVQFLAHELAHLRKADAPPIAAEEEAWAELVGSIAREAFTLVRARHTPPLAVRCGDCDGCMVGRPCTYPPHAAPQPEPA
ncbi:hypothetical protein [Gemmatimonas sp.]